MTIADILRTLSPDPMIALWTIEGLEMGERWDPQMTDAEKAEVHSAKLRVQRDLARQGRRG